MSDERNVSLVRRASIKPRTPPVEQAARSISVLLRGIYHTLDTAQLRPFFIRRSTELGQRMRAETEARALSAATEAEHSRAIRRLRREQLQEMRTGFKWTRIRVAKPPPKPHAFQRETPVTKQTKPVRALPAYTRPIVDREGRRGIVLAIEYDGARTNRFGVARRRILYATDPAKVEFDGNQPLWRSNMGDDLVEILACADAVETINRTARRNAKIGLDVVLQCAPELGHQGRIALLKRVEEHFVALGIPFVAALHPPDEGGDQRNYHIHIWTTFRPMVRAAPYNFVIADQLRTDLDGRDGLRELRRDCAWMLTEVARAHGHKLTFTHLSNVARQLPHKPVPKLAPADVARWRRGEHVGTIAAYGRLIWQNEQLTRDIAGRPLRMLAAAIKERITVRIFDLIDERSTIAIPAEVTAKQRPVMARLQAVDVRAAQPIMIPPIADPVPSRPTIPNWQSSPPRASISLSAAVMKRPDIAYRDADAGHQSKHMHRLARMPEMPSVAVSRSTVRAMIELDFGSELLIRPGIEIGPVDFRAPDRVVERQRRIDQLTLAISAAAADAMERPPTDRVATPDMPQPSSTVMPPKKNPITPVPAPAEHQFRNLDFAEREVRAGRAVAFSDQGALVVSAYAKDDEHVIPLDPQDRLRADAIVARAERMIVKVERDCSANRIALGRNGSLVGTTDVSLAWVVFAQRLLADEDYASRVRYALGRGLEARKLEQFRRDKEAADDRRKARSAAANQAKQPQPPQPPPSPSAVEKSRVRPARKSSRTAHTEQELTRERDILPKAH